MIKPLMFIVCLIPAGQLAYAAYIGDLGVNPIEFITRFTGSWALIILIASLAVTPLRRLTGWNELIKFRRMLGLFAFFYALLHFSTYLVLDHFFDFAAIGKDILKRPYVTAGFIGFVVMIPLAVTSTAGMIRRLGKRWQQLHRLVYVAAIAGVIHFYWLVKADISRPAQYGAVLALLLGYRLFVKWRPRLAATLAKRSRSSNPLVTAKDAEITK
ncbi:MAG TPA: protein-methionine-sulfoxide reductase heme-binding subunit MsrQ [Candidatus Binatia bacterium]|nr:protein-methionine-sulfoxide reductase heme-binding subunit MsrQ [Candidatus Binatia bacterium]